MDGQQRLSTIAGALYWNGDNPQSNWNIAYDLREENFIHLDSLDDPPLHQIRMNKVPDPSSYFQHVASLDTLNSPDKDRLKQNAGMLFNRFKDYKIATVTLGVMPIDDVAPIFERINSSGTQLTIVDLMRAATWSMEFDLIDAIDETLSALAAKGFGGLDRKVILRGMSAAAGGGFSAESIDGLRKFSPEKLKEAAETTTEAGKRAVDFLATQIKIPNDAVIPYANQFVVLSEVFRRIPRPSAEQYREINSWFWRTSMSGYFSGWNTGQMATDLREIESFASGKVETIGLITQTPRPEIWIARNFRNNNAHSKILAILLSYLDPIDLLTGQRIDVSKSLAWTNAKEFHHFFPRDYLKSKGELWNRSNSLANIILISSASNKTISNRAPSDYLSDVEKAAGTSLQDWLDTHLITREAYEAALQDDFDKFLDIRARTIHSAVLGLANWEC